MTGLSAKKRIRHEDSSYQVDEYLSASHGDRNDSNRIEKDK